MITVNTVLPHFSCYSSQRVGVKNQSTAPASSARLLSPLCVYSYPVVNFKGAKELRIQRKLEQIVRRNQSVSSPFIIGIKEGFLAKISNKLAKNNKEPLVIGVAGEPASGKSTFVKLINESVINLSSSRNDLVTAINCDSYYEDLTEQLKIHNTYGHLLENGYDPHNPKTQDINLLKQHLISLKNGQDVFIPEYLFDKCQSLPEQVLKKPSKIVLYEGIFALDSKLKDVADIKIYIQTPEELTQSRYLERAASRGKDEDTAKKLLSTLEVSTQKYIRSAKEKADLVISGNASKEVISSIINDMSTLFH